jgi:trehalose/maltose hydrolase-like predicted phosphorylase
MDVAMAFIAYYQISGDEVFLRERAWPVVKGVADWIESRVTKTKRGYEILFVTGIDEGTDNVGNDSFTNIICKTVLGSR